MNIPAYLEFLGKAPGGNKISVTIYPIDRKTVGGAYEEGVAADFPDGRSVPKDYPGHGDFIYRLRARFENGSYKTLQESGTITV